MSGNTYVGMILMSHVVIGVWELPTAWVGTVLVEIRTETENTTWNMPTPSDAEWELGFIPQEEGTYTVFIQLSGLPVIGSVERMFNITVTQPVISIEMDPGTTPVLSSGMVFGIIGLVLRRRLNGVVDTISGEWET